MSDPAGPILAFRVAHTATDFERAVRFWCDGLGVEPVAVWPEEHGKAMMLELGSATLELFDETQAATVDRLEAGGRVSGQVRFALRVPDLDVALKRLLRHGATLVYPPVETPWGDRNVRLADPDGMQITLFETGDPPR